MLAASPVMIILRLKNSVPLSIKALINLPSCQVVLFIIRIR